MSVREEVNVGLWQEVGDKREKRSRVLAPPAVTPGWTLEEGAGPLLLQGLGALSSGRNSPELSLQRELEDSSSLKASNEGTKLQIFVNTCL